jgi:hypothetical protein
MKANGCRQTSVGTAKANLRSEVIPQAKSLTGFHLYYILPFLFLAFYDSQALVHRLTCSLSIELD